LNTNASDQERLQGTWRVVQFESRKGGYQGPHPEHGTETFEFVGNRVTWRTDCRVSWIYRLDVTKSPPQIDLFPAARPERNDWHGVYQFRGQELLLSLGRSEAPRPARVTVERGDEHVVYHLVFQNGERRPVPTTVKSS
jgi:uncharacterized protein (TIGR03067 family)